MKAPVKNGTTKNNYTNAHAPQFRHYVRNGREVVRIPPNLLDNGANRLDLTRLTNDPRDLASIIEYRLCEMMAMAGFSHKGIARTLGMPASDIKYRLQRLHIKLKDYRDGTSRLAKEVIGRLDAVAQRRLVENLEKYLLK